MTSFYWIAGMVLVIIMIFLPKVGIVAVLRTYRDSRQREQMEDALKHLLDCERQGRRASSESLAGALNVSRSRVTDIIASMESQGFIETQGTELHLTSRGESWAMHIVRAHRLWERYLADEARMPLGRVHTEAHHLEHKSSKADLDSMDAAMGYPTHDPHGDPIPTRDGQMPSEKTTPLTAWQTDRPALIVHLEDEPPIAYEQILAVGLKLGQTIRILERTPQRIIVSDGETEYRLAPAIAANVSLAPLPDRLAEKPSALSLADLPQDREAEIVGLDESVQGFTRRRFLDLGLTPGTRIRPELGNFFKDPRGYRVRGALIALRQDQASQIWVAPIDGKRSTTIPAQATDK